MDEQQPLVTLVVTTFNSRLYVAEAIKSVLAQSYPRIEIIVVDDGSSDDTLAIVEAMNSGARIIRQSNSGGPSRPRNAGIAVAKGEYIGFLDPDDLLDPGKLEHQVACLQRHPEAAMVMSNYRNFHEKISTKDHMSACTALTPYLQDKPEHLFRPGQAADILIDQNFSITGAPLYRTSVVRALGGFNERLHACEDYVITYRVAMDYPVLVDKTPVFLRRFHDNNVSSDTPKMYRYYIESRLSLSREEPDEGRRSRLKQVAQNHLKSFIKRSLRHGSLADWRSALRLAWHTYGWPRKDNKRTL